MILWGSFAAVSKLALHTLDSFQLQFYMFGMASIILCIMLLLRGWSWAQPKISTKGLLKLAALSVPSYLYFFFYTLSLKLLPAVEASSLNYLFPILIVLLAVPINGEKLSVFKIAALIIGFCGTLIILSKGNLQTLKMTNLGGDLLAISGAVSFALFTGFLKRNRVDMLLTNTVIAVCSFLFSGIALVMFSHFTLPGLPVLGLILWLGVSNLVLSYFVWNRLIKKCSSSLSANISFMTPFSTLLFILILLGEKISVSQIIGLMVIVCGIALTGLSEKRMRLKKHSE
jgi:drug/metabolite transporter (DMT)-like permease